jgi:hypothetical protein
MQDIEELQRIQTRSGEGLTKEERKEIEIEESLETLSRYLDGLFKVPGVGWRFGLDALVGLIPNVGDISTSLLSFYILIAGVRYGVPKITLLRMAFNIGLDYLVGVIPFIGDAFDFFWKSNHQNMELIRKHGTGRGTGSTSDWLFVVLIIGFLIALLVGSIFASLFIIGLVFGSIFNMFS